MRFKPRKPKSRISQPDHIINERIRATTMRLIDEKGGQIAVISKAEALEMAKEQNKDLVLIAEAATPPVVKLIAYSKFRYQVQQKKQEEKRSNKKTDIKELRLSPFIAEGDLNSRIDRVRDFLESGFKVRLHVRFKGRQITKTDFGDSVLNRIIEKITDVGQVEIEPKMQGKMMTCQLMPIKK